MTATTIIKQLTVAKTGNEAMADAMRQVNPDVVAAYPITPATEIAQIFSSFVADGMVTTDMVTVESEHSAMSATIGAAAAGARAMTATASQGLMLMAEMLPIAAALRLPIVMPEVNRAISGPINIHCDHSDTMFCRDAGWLQIFSENAQEAYDNVLQAVKIAEDPRVHLPALVTTDGFIISHGMETIKILPDDEAKSFVGEYKPNYSLLNHEKPITVGSIDLQNYYFEHRIPMIEAMKTAKDIIKQVGREYGEKYGRFYDLIEQYKIDDAEVALICLGSTAGTAKDVVDALRTKGQKVGLIKIRVFRPFPVEDLAAALRNLRAAAVFDRSDSLSGYGGPVFTEVCSALFNSENKPKIVNYIYGLGGRDIDIHTIEAVYDRLNKLKDAQDTGEIVSYLGVRK
ncbi:pyruvate:ferredoxin oxidoreductase subunit alpha [Candidatus Termititenax persephonae]|uniref:Pyruvate:ferredoxin oxidoreductase subunit alpha n=1 Tax=Candidatus Termititenax persephonae TaxID=2218525 RepID=A0A388TFH2_9BACT|nr:pyruvate:ferredoxin oxidoreductase subunit alpha [Candidatus Termititenax persephonae]